MSIIPRPKERIRFTADRNASSGDAFFTGVFVSIGGNTIVGGAKVEVERESLEPEYEGSAA